MIEVRRAEGSPPARDDPDCLEAAPPPGLLRRWLPRPWTVLWLLLTWLLLNQTVAVGHLLLGLVLALVLARVAGPAQRRRAGATVRRAWWRRAFIAARLAAAVLWDIVVSNVQVAVRILGPQETLTPRFVWVPLDVRQPHSITLLAGIITMTPGTLSTELSDDHRWLLVHGLDVEDPDDLVAGIKERYEAPIKEMFE
jgi:multicomponent K+:H+ antiporter subunit E